MDESDEEIYWRGCSMQEIYRNLNEWELKHVPPVRPSEAHTVLYQFPVKKYDEPPKPHKGHSKWDAYHVRLPCSPKSQYPVTKSDGTVSIESRWEMIQQALLRPITNSRELEAAIKSYNSKYENLWNFKGLHKLFEEELDEDEGNIFFEDLLPKIIRLALRLPELVQTAIPLLKQGQNRSISLSQQQVASLLANAFLCTYPRRNTMKKKSEYSTFPDINFNRLFQSSGQQVVEKIKCICHYFRRVCNNPPLGVITMTRRFLSESELPNWSECNAPLGVTPLHITSAGTIEDQGKGLLQVDFANKYLGGGVLGSGCVQEEIRFVICPELIVSKLFTEALKPNEALVMVGCEQFSTYSGYAGTFKWDGNFEDHTPFDDSRRRQCHIVAIDALYFVQSSHQYREELMLRELNKAYVGFFHPLSTPAPGVASGNWGCGAFGGEATLKALLQLMACTITKRPLVYFTFGNRELRDAVHSIHTFFIENNVTVKQLWRYLREFRSHKLLPNDLYSFICQVHRDYQNRQKGASVVSRVNFPFKFLKKSVVQQSGHEYSSTASGRIAQGSREYSGNNGRVAQESKDSQSDLRVDPTKEDDQLCEEVQRELNVSDDLFADISMPGVMDCQPAQSAGKDEASKSGEEKVSDKGKVSPEANQAKKSEPRQRTLIEMLDVFYTGSPAKRHCSTGKQNI